MNRQVLSRKRVIDHGEVFTPPGLVNDMLDLVCRSGMFPREIARRLNDRLHDQMPDAFRPSGPDSTQHATPTSARTRSIPDR